MPDTTTDGVLTPGPSANGAGRPTSSPNPWLHSPAMAPASAPEADLRDYLRVVWRRKWLGGLVVVLCVAAGVGASFLEKPTYTAKADILLQSSSPAAALLGGSGASLSPTDVATQIQIVTSAPVTQEVSRQLHQPAPQVSVTEVGQTNVIEVAASSHSAATAARIANAYARAYLTFRRDQNVNASLSAASAVQAKLSSVNRQIASLTSGHGASKQAQQLAALQTEQATYQAQLNQLQADASLQNGAAELITPATAPSVPSSPNPKRTGLIGLAVGLVLGIGGVLLADTLDDRIRAKEELQGASGGLPVLGLVPALPGWRDRRKPQLASLASPHSATTEAYRQLRTSLQFLHLDHHRLQPGRDAGRGRPAGAPGGRRPAPAPGQRVLRPGAGARAHLGAARGRGPGAHPALGEGGGRPLAPPLGTHPPQPGRAAERAPHGPPGGPAPGPRVHRRGPHRLPTRAPGGRCRGPGRPGGHHPPRHPGRAHHEEGPRPDPGAPGAGGRPYQRPGPQRRAPQAHPGLPLPLRLRVRLPLRLHPGQERKRGAPGRQRQVASRGSAPSPRHLMGPAHLMDRHVPASSPRRTPGR